MNASLIFISLLGIGAIWAMTSLIRTACEYVRERRIRDELIEQSKAETERWRLSLEHLAKLPAARPASEGFAMFPGSRVWFELSPTAKHANVVMGSFTDADNPQSHGDFWLAISASDGAPLGWLMFRYVTCINGQPVFAASQWRSASSPNPPPSNTLLPPAAQFPEAA